MSNDPFGKMIQDIIAGKETDQKTKKTDAEVRTSRLMQAKFAYEEISDEELENEIFSYKRFIPNNEQFYFFWESSSKFSQWYPSSINEMDQIFTSAEQYMMYHKAELFLDRKIAKKILLEGEPREIKKLGRQIKYFDEILWDFNKINIVYNGNKLKFMQNEEFKKLLVSTSGLTLVEASPDDTVWGIGLSEKDNRSLNRKSWLGKNLLGEILTQIRYELMGFY